MTFRDIVTSMLRRWYVPTVILLCAGLLTVAFVRDGGGFTTKTVVAFLLPSKTSLSQGNGADDASVIAFAGTVAQELNNGRPADLYSTDDAPFYGAGVRQGVLITLPDAGNQWISSYLRAEIELQIVGRTAEWVQARQAGLLDDVQQIVAAQQSTVTDRTELIRASVVPLTTKIERIEADGSAQMAAAAAMLLAALIVGAWGSVVIDRFLRRRRRSGRGTTAQASPRLFLSGSAS